MALVLRSAKDPTLRYKSWAKRFRVVQFRDAATNSWGLWFMGR